MGGCVRSLFCNAVFCCLFSFAIISRRKRELIALLLYCSFCRVVPLPRDAVVYECGISWFYSLTFFVGLFHWSHNITCSCDFIKCRCEMDICANAYLLLWYVCCKAILKEWVKPAQEGLVLITLLSNADSPDRSLIAYTKYWCRWRRRPMVRLLTPQGRIYRRPLRICY